MSGDGLPRSLRYSRQAARTLLRMDRRTSRLFRAKIDPLAADPGALANNVSALKGESALKRLRIGGWRVIFTEDLVVLHVLKIGPRGSAYG